MSLPKFPVGPIEIPEWMPEHPAVVAFVDNADVAKDYAERFALLAVEAYKKSLVPVAWITAPHGVLRYDPNFSLNGPQTLDWRIPLYRMDK